MLKFTHNPPKTTLGAHLRSVLDRHRVNHLRHPTCVSPAEVQGDGLPPSCFSSHPVNKHLHPGPSSDSLSTFSCFFVGDCAPLECPPHPLRLGCDAPYGENACVRLALFRRIDKINDMSSNKHTEDEPTYWSAEKTGDQRHGGALPGISPGAMVPYSLFGEFRGSFADHRHGQ